MRIKNITLDNFKCFEHLEMNFHPSMNLIVGINGTGKSSVLEALRILLGSLFLSVDKYKDKIQCPGIVNDDVRLSQLEQQYPVKVSAVAEMNGFDGNQTLRDVSWERSLETRCTFPFVLRWCALYAVDGDGTRFQMLYPQFALGQ